MWSKVIVGSQEGVPPISLVGGEILGTNTLTSTPTVFTSGYYTYLQYDSVNDVFNINRPNIVGACMGAAFIQGAVLNGTLNSGQAMGVDSITLNGSATVTVNLKFPNMSGSSPGNIIHIAPFSSDPSTQNTMFNFYELDSQRTSLSFVVHCQMLDKTAFPSCSVISVPDAVKSFEFSVFPIPNVQY